MPKIIKEGGWASLLRSSLNLNYDLCYLCTAPNSWCVFTVNDSADVYCLSEHTVGSTKILHVPGTNTILIYKTHIN